MPWEKKYVESDVVDQAMWAFWAHGYAATSVNDLVRETGINRGSLYAAFSDKRSLFLAALRAYDEQYREDFFLRVAAERPPREAIVAAFEGAARQSATGDVPAGCLMVNTALEVSPHDPEIRALVKASLGKVEDFFFEMIEAAKSEGAVPRVLAPRTTAQALLGLFLGLRVLTRSGADTATLNAVISQARRLLA